MSETAEVREAALTPIASLTPHPRNYRDHPPEQIEHIAASIREHGFYRNVVATHDGTILAGHGAVEAARSVGLDEIPVVRVPFDPDSPAALKLLAADNTLGLFASDDHAALADLLGDVDTGVGLIGTGFPDAAAIDDLLAIGTPPKDESGATGYTLAQRYIAPPLSVIRTYTGEWQSRKREWMERYPALRGHEGRDEFLTYETNKMDYFSKLPSTSVFDPVLAEILTRWFSAEGDVVFDPYAGGPARGIVAADLGRRYTGGDIREDQVAANYETVEAEGFAGSAEWHLADARDEPHPCLGGHGGECDLILTCPPYGDLEKYSGSNQHDGDISSFNDDDFTTAYMESVTSALTALRHERFAAFVVGYYRPASGDRLRCMIGPTTEAAESVEGVEFYNSAVLSTPFANAAPRSAGIFPKRKKLTPVHQNILIYVRGDAQAAADRCEPLGEAIFFMEDDVDDDGA